MEADYWHERWASGQIGFHQAVVNPWLTKYWQQLQISVGSGVLVPLCGKSEDLRWLTDQGYRAIGVEISQAALEAFFTAQRWPVQRRAQGAFEVWSSGEVSIYCGDLFGLRAEDLPSVHAIYDRAALVALPVEMRQRYVRHLQRILPPPIPHLVISLEYDPTQMTGPPFSVSAAEIESLYGVSYQVQCLAKNEVVDEQPHLRNKGLSSLVETVYHLQVP